MDCNDVLEITLFVTELGPSIHQFTSLIEKVAALIRLLDLVAGGMGQRRVWVHPSGFVQNPYTDVAPAGESPKSTPQRKLWHSSPGSSGW